MQRESPNASKSNSIQPPQQNNNQQQPLHISSEVSLPSIESTLTPMHAPQQQQAHATHFSLPPTSFPQHQTHQHHSVPTQIVSRETSFHPSHYYYPNFRHHEIPPLHSVHLPPTHHQSYIQQRQYVHSQQNAPQQSQPKTKQKRQSRKILPPGVAKNGRKMLISREEMMSKLDEMMKQKQTPGDAQTASEFATSPIPQTSQSSASSSTADLNSNSSNSSTSAVPLIESVSNSSLSSDESSNSSSSTTHNQSQLDSLGKMRLRFILNNQEEEQNKGKTV